LSEAILELTSRTLGTVQILAVRGRIDHAHANAFDAALAPHLRQCTAAGAGLVLDFSAVDFISSVGLRVLMLAAKQVKAQQGRIAVAALTPVVHEVFQVSRFNLVLKVFANADEAALALA
jgi:anti-sigma B factor antagonist